jgi:hypothetical protein
VPWLDATQSTTCIHPLLTFHLFTLVPCLATILQAGGNGGGGGEGADGAPSWWAPGNPYTVRTDIADLLQENKVRVGVGI